ncbi:hypothetical protein SETIT_3G100500v2 [Setaria italica]|uniref:Alliinase C-terminal domain-containing protein n=2 Tax=Setaria italica TaxID=4555 RepID=A0A368QDB2_SETIT|nr:hypothetical protein SETIT_3G100500v2 [Setaria italica]
MRGQRVVSTDRVFKSRGRFLLVLASRPRCQQHGRKIRLLRCCPAGSAVFASEYPVPVATMVAGGGERPWAPAGAAGLAVGATLLCNVASLAYLLRGYVVDGRRRRRQGCAARSGADDGALLADEETEAPDHAVALPPDAVLNLELGDPTMYEAFWREVGDRAATVIRGWQAMSYFSDPDALCWFLEPEFEREVRRLHRVVGNAVVDGYHLVVGTGATQLYQAAMYALSSPARGDKPVPVVSPAPYYSSYPPQTDLQLSGFYRWAGDASTFAGGECIELVCSPNNPDGAVRESVMSSAAGAKPIHDLVYYWPQYTPITGRAAHDIMLFTVSKITGHAGTRLGWALVKDREVAKKMVYFVDRSTIGVSKDSQLRATKILSVVSDAYEAPPAGDGGAAVPRLFDFARRRMEERWRTLRATVAASGAFSLPEEIAGYCDFNKQTVAACPAFAWLRCEKEDVEDCAEFLAGHKIVARGGKQFGGDARCVRINMLDRDQVFDMLVQRLSAIN